MAKALRVIKDDPELAAEEHLRQLDDKYLSCKGDRHDFPKLKPGPLPKNVHADRQRDGSFQMTWTCPDCGTEKTKTTLAKGVYARGAANSYKYPPGYLAPSGAGLAKADYATELYSRLELESGKTPPEPKFRAPGRGRAQGSRVQNRRR